MGSYLIFLIVYTLMKCFLISVTLIIASFFLSCNAPKWKTFYKIIVNNVPLRIFYQFLRKKKPHHNTVSYYIAM